jgi:hypothetical protein
MKTVYLFLFRNLLSCFLLFSVINPALSQVFKPFKEVESIPKDKAVVYIYWPNNKTGGMDYVYVNDRLASFLPLYSKGCLIYFADPGTNVFSAKLWRRGDLVLQIYPNESVFIRGFYMTGETSFRRIPPDEARNDLKKCNIYEKQCIADSERFKSIALVSTTISKAELPILPLLDASAFNEKVYSILGKIVAMQKLNLYQIRETAAREISAYFNAKVLFGDSLNCKPEMQELRKKHDTISPVIINGKSYPGLVTLNDDIKPFPDYKDNINRFFKDPDNYKEIISEIGQSLKTDLIAVCNMNYTLSTNSYAFTGVVNLYTQLYLFSADGTLVAKGDKVLQSSGSISGNNIQDFENALKMLPSALDLILEEITCGLYVEMSKK